MCYILFKKLEINNNHKIIIQKHWNDLRLLVHHNWQGLTIPEEAGDRCCCCCGGAITARTDAFRCVQVGENSGINATRGPKNPESNTGGNPPSPWDQNSKPTPFFPNYTQPCHRSYATPFHYWLRIDHYTMKKFLLPLAAAVGATLPMITNNSKELIAL